MFRPAFMAVSRRWTPASLTFSRGGVQQSPLSSSLRSRFFSSAPNVRLLDSAVNQLRKLKKQSNIAALRLKVNSGGCSGFEYEFSLIPNMEELSPEDIIIEPEDGVRLVVDKTTNLLLDACEIEYNVEMIRSSFQVSKNKLADQNCSCGSSFSVSF